MGMLDFVKRKEEPRRKMPFNTLMRCDKCNREFMGQEWMKKQTSKLITCKECWERTETWNFN